MVEYLFWIFTLDQKLLPESLRRDVLRYAFTNRAFYIEKAKHTLRYRPTVHTEEGINRGVEWARQNQADQQAKKNSMEEKATITFLSLERRLTLFCSHNLPLFLCSDVPSLHTFLPNSVAEQTMRSSTTVYSCLNNGNISILCSDTLNSRASNSFVRARRPVTPPFNTKYPKQRHSNALQGVSRYGIE